jgi:hypothetical protein
VVSERGSDGIASERAGGGGAGRGGEEGEGGEYFVRGRRHTSSASMKVATSRLAAGAA